MKDRKKEKVRQKKQKERIRNKKEKRRVGQKEGVSKREFEREMV